VPKGIAVRVRSRAHSSKRPVHERRGGDGAIFLNRVRVKGTGNFTATQLAESCADARAFDSKYLVGSGARPATPVGMAIWKNLPQ
jgi:hypothetical protein